MAAKALIIKVPASSANIGPGFDAIGLALSIYVTLRITTHPNPSSHTPLNCVLSYSGVSSLSVPLNPAANLITRTALYVLRCHGQHAFPPNTHVHIDNQIPLGRGLGSSGAAVVAGVMLGNEVGRLDLPKARLLDYALMIERHPDNVAAALYGGLVGTYLSELSAEATSRKEIPLSEVLPEPAGGEDTGLSPPEPPIGIGHYKRFNWAPEIKAIAIIPSFEVSTAKARDVLPTSYTRADLVFNIQRIALLPSALGESPPNHALIHLAMQDKIHQPYRATLIPGLTQILASVTPATHQGLCGICLSGAGPTILALATADFEGIAKTILDRFKNEGIECDWKLLEPATEGATTSWENL